DAPRRPARRRERGGEDEEHGRAPSEGAPDAEQTRAALRARGRDERARVAAGRAARRLRPARGVVPREAARARDPGGALELDGLVAEGALGDPHGGPPRQAIPRGARVGLRKHGHEARGLVSAENDVLFAPEAVHRWTEGNGGFGGNGLTGARPMRAWSSLGLALTRVAFMVPIKHGGCADRPCRRVRREHRGDQRRTFERAAEPPRFALP